MHRQENQTHYWTIRVCWNLPTEYLLTIYQTYGFQYKRISADDTKCSERFPGSASDFIAECLHIFYTSMSGVIYVSPDCLEVMNFDTQCIYVLVWVSQQIMLVFLNIINPLVFIMGKGCSVCEVGAEFIRTHDSHHC